MVTVSTLVVATRESAERIARVGARLGEHEIPAENVGGTKLISARSCVHQTAGNDDVVQHLRGITVNVGGIAVSEKLPHRVIQVVLGEFLRFGLGVHLLENALRGRIVVEVSHIDELRVGAGLQHRVCDAAAKLPCGQTTRWYR